jgi:hypothetical protein
MTVIEKQKTKKFFLELKKRSKESKDKNQTISLRQL